MLPGQTVKVFVKNISDDDITITELNGYVIEPDEEINMLDDGLPAFYNDHEAVLRAINDLTVTSLYTGVHATPPTLEYRVEGQE